jgi:hypothetical protein
MDCPVVHPNHSLHHGIVFMTKQYCPVCGAAYAKVGESSNEQQQLYRHPLSACKYDDTLMFNIELIRQAKQESQCQSA